MTLDLLSRHRHREISWLRMAGSRNPQARLTMFVLRVRSCFIAKFNSASHVCCINNLFRQVFRGSTNQRFWDLQVSFARALSGIWRWLQMSQDIFKICIGLGPMLRSSVPRKEASGLSRSIPWLHLLIIPGVRTGVQAGSPSMHTNHDLMTRSARV